MKHIFLISLMLLSAACVSTKSTLKNVDNDAPAPKLSKENTFIIDEFSTDPKYGYHPDYPVNIFYSDAKNEDLNPQRFLNALAGPEGEKLFYKKLESCCPFPTKRSEMGAGFLDVYEVNWVGNKKPVKLYLNIYERGRIMIPMGLGQKKVAVKPEGSLIK
jgi:hypothetical protein